MGDGRVERPGSTAPSFCGDLRSPRGLAVLGTRASPRGSHTTSFVAGAPAAGPVAPCPAASCIESTAGRSRNRRERLEESCLELRAERGLQKHVLKCMGGGGKEGGIWRVLKVLHRWWYRPGNLNLRLTWPHWHDRQVGPRGAHTWATHVQLAMRPGGSPLSQHKKGWDRREGPAGGPQPAGASTFPPASQVPPGLDKASTHHKPEASLPISDQDLVW